MRSYMIHGHIHNDTSADFYPLIAARENVLNAGVDINGFRPVTFEELLENNRRILKKAAFIPAVCNGIMLLSHCISPAETSAGEIFPPKRLTKSTFAAYNHRVKSRNGTKSEVNVHGSLRMYRTKPGMRCAVISVRNVGVHGHGVTTFPLRCVPLSRRIRCLAVAIILTRCIFMPIFGQKEDTT